MSFTPQPVDPTLDLVLEREVDVPPAAVWRAWTTPELLTQWFAPKPYETVECEIDLRRGGVFRTVMRSPEGEDTENANCYLDVVAERRLVWSTALGPGYRPRPDAPMPMTAVIELEPTAGGGTRYRATVLHRDPADAAQHAELGFAAGWGAALDQLVDLVR